MYSATGLLHIKPLACEVCPISWNMNVHPCMFHPVNWQRLSYFLLASSLLLPDPFRIWGPLHKGKSGPHCRTPAVLSTVLLQLFTRLQQPLATAPCVNMCTCARKHTHTLDSDGCTFHLVPLWHCWLDSTVKNGMSSLSRQHASKLC